MSSQLGMARRYIFEELRGLHPGKRKPKPEVMFEEVISRGWARIVRRRGKPPLLVWNEGKPS